MAARATRFDVAKAGGRFALLAQTGSRAYGTHHSGSDYDFKGVYVASRQRMFSLAGARQRIIGFRQESAEVVFGSMLC